jgi:predicted enzyme related to lactoylglutathione lyase
MSQPPVNLLVIRARDAGATARFYEALGFRFYRARFGDGPDAYCSVASASTYLQVHPAGRRSPTSGLCFGVVVPSVDAAVSAAVEHGGAVLTPPVSWSVIGRRAAVADPDGNRVELAESEFGRPTGDYPE